MCRMSYASVRRRAAQRMAAWPALQHTAPHATHVDTAAASSTPLLLVHQAAVVGGTPKALHRRRSQSSAVAERTATAGAAAAARAAAAAAGARHTARHRLGGSGNAGEAAGKGDDVLRERRVLLWDTRGREREGVCLSAVTLIRWYFSLTPCWPAARRHEKHSTNLSAGRASTARSCTLPTPHHTARCSSPGARSCSYWSGSPWRGPTAHPTAWRSGCRGMVAADLHLM